MTLTLAEIVEIENVLAAQPSPAPGEALRTLRDRLAGRRVLLCDAADVKEPPFRSFGAVDVHLLDTREHCVTVTGDLRHATGVLLVARVQP